MQPYYYEIGNEDGMLVYSINNSGNTITYPPIVTGTYYFIVSDAAGCLSDTVFVDVTIEDPPAFVNDLIIKDLEIFPNPSNAIFNLSFYSDYNHKIKLRIVNIIGEVILKQVINVQIGDFRKEINLDNYPNSIYFLELETDNGLIIKKLVLQD